MEYRLLGSSDLKVSVIGLGCMSIPNLEEGKAIIHQALDYGVNFFDTADLYQQGENEKIVGSVLKEKRSEVILATKVGNQWRADGSGWDWNPSKAYIKTAVHNSLRRLQTDYIDLYQLHGGTIDDPIDETIEAFEELKAEGSIRHYGISSIRPNVMREYIQRSNIVSNMMQYSLLDRRPEEWALEALNKAGKRVIVRGALARGILASKAAIPYLGHEEASVAQLKATLANFSNMQLSSGQIALHYVLASEAVATIALGASSAIQLEQSLKGFDASQSLSFLAELKKAIPPHVYQKHR